MGPIFAVILLALDTVCHGAALSDQNWMKRDLKRDQTFNFYGVHMSLSYFDPAVPLKGGDINLKVDDVKKIFPNAQITKMIVRTRFNSKKVKDGIFEIGVNYGFLHGDGKWEQGTFEISRFYQQDILTHHINSECKEYSGVPIVPAAISNFEFRLGLNIQNHFEVLYANRNPTINRYMHLSLKKISVKTINLMIVNGGNPRTFEQLKDYKHDFNFIYDLFELDFRKMVAVFSVAVEGTSLGENVKGKFAGFEKDGQVIQFQLEKGNKEIIQLETKIQIDGQYYEARTKYALLGGKITGRNNQVKIFIDSQNWNLLAPKFKIEVHLEKDGAKVVDMTADTTGSPYVFKLSAPNLLKDQASVDITVDHKIGRSLVIDANILGGFHLEGKHTDNAKNGRDFSLSTRIDNNQMFKITRSTEIINNVNEFRFILNDSIDVNSDCILYKNIISKYKLLTPFNSRTGQYEFYVNKKNKNILLNKFFVKGKVHKDGVKRMDLFLSTNEKPYKFELFAPSLLGKLKPGMNEAKILIDHTLGQSLEVKTNFAKFTGLKIYKTGVGNERKVELKGKDLILGDYSLTDNSFSAKITLGDEYVEPKITWEGTPINAKISLNTRGNNIRWGDYSLSRKINWKVENHIVEVDWSGLAQFTNGWLASSDPIETSFKFKVLLDKNDLVGKFMKKIDGNEFSIEFTEGSGLIPKIIMGQ